MRRQALILVFISGCSVQDAPPAPNPAALDVAFFECNVQPILDRNCAFPACHGDPGRPFFVYSMSKTRIGGESSIGETLTEQEVCRNFSRAASFARPDERSELTTKPSTLDGFASLYHEGNYLFGPDDPETRCLNLWMKGAALTGSVAAANDDCKLPWRTYSTETECEVRKLDCAAVVARPDVAGEDP